MLPFARMLEYGNEVINWYTGTEIMAFDSTLLVDVNNIEGTFTDFTGKTIANTTHDNMNTAHAYIYDYTFQYGTGIAVPNTVFLCSTEISASFLLDSWCVDFWICQPLGTTRHMNCNALVCTSLKNTSSSQTRYLFGSFVFGGFDSVGIFNNTGAGGSSLLPAAYMDIGKSTTWVHLCIQ